MYAKSFPYHCPKCGKTAATFETLAALRHHIEISHMKEISLTGNSTNNDVMGCRTTFKDSDTTYRKISDRMSHANETGKSSRQNSLTGKRVPAIVIHSPTAANELDPNFYTQITLDYNDLNSENSTADRFVLHYIN